ncbi:MAG: hypothetical protein J0M16_00450 [Gammaproteobacteria bacterium]|nr:hypothetical protein [Gammaproteobacteria bacterium]
MEPGDQDERTRPLTRQELADAEAALAEVNATLAAHSDLSEDGLAVGFARTRENFRYVAAEATWKQWTGSLWGDDKTLSVYTKIREFVRWRAQHETDSEKVKKDLKQAKTISAIERLLRSDPRYAATIDQWDRDPWQLNTPGGLVNLRTGSLGPSDREAYCTRITAVTPQGECPLWRRFLNDVTEGDQELIDFLQRLFGYALTGSVREHTLAFVYGSGGNGKGVLLGTLMGVFGTYAGTAPSEVFMESRNDRHPTELAHLKGHRLIISQEVDQGRRWNESRLKSLTGGDPITARKMRGDPFTFQPAFKLVVAGNHRPRLNSVDEAIRRRLLLIPFSVTVPASRRDPDLAEKLRAEWPGILNWCVAGCLDYLAQGLCPPDRVRAATDAYLKSQDVMGDWFEANLETGPDYWVSPTDLFSDWRSYMEKFNEGPGKQTEFAERLESRGYFKKKDNARGRYWAGLRLRRSAGSSDPPEWA